MNEQDTPPTEPSPSTGASPSESSGTRETPPAIAAGQGAAAAPAGETAPTATPPAAPAAAPPKKKGGWGKWVALGCGCLFLVVVAVGLILAAIAIPTFTAAKSKAQDAQAAIKLRNGVTAAVTYYTDKYSYDGLNAAELGKLESSVRFQDGAPGPDLKQGIIYLDPASVSKDSFQMTVKSESGTLIRAGYSKSGMKFEKSDNGVTWKDLTSE